MDIRALRYFNAVYEFGNHSRASEYLLVTQPAVSRQNYGGQTTFISPPG